MGQKEQERHHAHQVVEELQGILAKGLGCRLDARDRGELQAHECQADKAYSHANLAKQAWRHPGRSRQSRGCQRQQDQEEVEAKSHGTTYYQCHSRFCSLLGQISPGSRSGRRRPYESEQRGAARLAPLPAHLRADVVDVQHYDIFPWRYFRHSTKTDTWEKRSHARSSVTTADATSIQSVTWFCTRAIS